MVTAEVTEPTTGEGSARLEPGIYLVGGFLGIKRPEPYDIDGKKGNSRPKIGLDVDGVEYAVVVAEERDLYVAQRDWQKGDVVSLRVYPKAGRFGLSWSTSPTVGSWE